MKWKVLETQNIFKSRVVNIRVDKCELPNRKIMPNYYVLQFPAWVNIVPITEDKRIVLIKQYRHAVGETTYEVPGGMVDLGEKPEVAAERELAEETGYTGRKLKLVGEQWPNPAIQNNFLYTYVASDCRKTGELNLDPFEDIEVEVQPIPEVFKMIRDGRIRHSLVIASLFYSLRDLGITFPE